jgi:beta-barrel assembly-enhancing protease
VAQQLSHQNGGLQQASQLVSVTVGGRPGNAVELRGQSPVVDGGSQMTERDWLVTVVRPDGALNYMVFVAPEPDFATLKPVFSAMVESFRMR